MRHLKAAILCGILGAIAATPSWAQFAAFNFSNASVGTNDPSPLGGTASPFSVAASSGDPITALFQTLQGSFNSSQFGIAESALNGAPAGGSPIQGNFLFGGRTDLDAAGITAEAALCITFSGALSDLHFDYLIGGLDGSGTPVSTPLIVEAFSNTSAAYVDISGGGLVPGPDNGNGWFEGSSGVLSLPASETFTKVRLWGGGDKAPLTEFGIDNLRGTVAVPEPGAVATLLGGGLAGTLFLVSRRRK